MDEEPVVKNVYLFAVDEKGEVNSFKGNLYSTFHPNKLFFISGENRFKCSAYPGRSFHLSLWLYGNDMKTALNTFIQEYEKRNLRLRKEIKKHNQLVKKLKKNRELLGNYIRV